MDLDELLAGVDAAIAARREPVGRQPVHTVYVPADRFTESTVDEWRAAALESLHRHGPVPLQAQVEAKLRREPIEDLRVDFEDGYGGADEDADARRIAGLLPAVGTPFKGIRIKSLEKPTRARALRTLDLVGGDWIVTLPKVSAPEQVQAMATLCERFEVQIEVPQAIPVLREIVEAGGAGLIGLHYGTYDYSAALGIAAAYQSLEHPAADYAKQAMQIAVAGTAVRLSDGSTNVLPVGSRDEVRAAWDLHARLVRRSLERGFYQGWDLHPAHLVTRYSATYGFFREGAQAVVDRLQGRVDGILDEPATTRAMARYLLRALDCGAVESVPFDRTVLESL
jgi:citrate lyase beta subunit